MTGLIGAFAALVGMLTNCAWTVNGDAFELWSFDPETGAYTYSRSHPSAGDARPDRREA